MRRRHGDSRYRRIMLVVGAQRSCRERVESQTKSVGIAGRHVGVRSSRRNRSRYRRGGWPLVGSLVWRMGQANRGIAGTITGPTSEGGEDREGSPTPLQWKPPSRSRREPLSHKSHAGGRPTDQRNRERGVESREGEIAIREEREMARRRHLALVPVRRSGRLVPRQPVNARQAANGCIRHPPK